MVQHFALFLCASNKCVVPLPFFSARVLPVLGFLKAANLFILDENYQQDTVILRPNALFAESVVIVYDVLVDLLHSFLGIHRDTRREAVVPSVEFLPPDLHSVCFAPRSDVVMLTYLIIDILIYRDYESPPRILTTDVV